MIEQGIYFALGSVVTALLALSLGPIFWSRAMRLSRRRLQLQVPLSMREIIAERDQLRAEFAVEQLRLEQKMAEVEATKAHDMAEIGRRTMETVAATTEASSFRKQDEAGRQEIARLTREFAEAEAERGALQNALNDAHAFVDRAKGEKVEFQAENLRLRQDSDRQRVSIASLQMRVGDTEEAGLNRAKSIEGLLRTRLETAMAQAARHESNGLQLRRECDDAKAQLRALEAEVARLKAAVTAGHSGQEAGGAQPATAETDTELRASIHALGKAVAAMTRERREATVESARARGTRRKSEASVEVH